MLNYSIGITTYSYRYERFLVNLISQIRKNNQNELILAINGNHMETFDEDYRRNILKLSSAYYNIFPFIYPNFRSLAKLWNNIMINASNNYVLILNDDISIFDPIFWKSVEENIEKYQTSFKMDHTFCYFVAKRDEIEQVGWFDERFLSIGWEDTEFIERYEKILGKTFLDLEGIPGAKRFDDFQNIIVNQRKSYKYSAFNQEVYNRKLPPVAQYPHEKFFWEFRNKI
jgi:hypothetical protein